MEKEIANNNLKLTFKRVSYSEKYGGDDVHAEIWKEDEMVGQIFWNGYLKTIRGVDLRLSDRNNNDERAYYRPNVNLTFEEQIVDAISGTISIINKNNILFV